MADEQKADMVEETAPIEAVEETKVEETLYNKQQLEDVIKKKISTGENTNL